MADVDVSIGERGVRRTEAAARERRNGNQALAALERCALNPRERPPRLDAVEDGHERRAARGKEQRRGREVDMVGHDDCPWARGRS
jgi:hypothetical protein